MKDSKTESDLISADADNQIVEAAISAWSQSSVRDYVSSGSKDAVLKLPDLQIVDVEKLKVAFFDEDWDEFESGDEPAPPRRDAPFVPRDRGGYPPHSVDPEDEYGPAGEYGPADESGPAGEYGPVGEYGAAIDEDEWAPQADEVVSRPGALAPPLDDDELF